MTDKLYLGSLLLEIEKWSEKYDMNFQFWNDDNSVFLYAKGTSTELFSNGGLSSPQEVIKEVLKFIYRVNRTPKDKRVKSHD
jgi:hypothetical protein